MKSPHNDSPINSAQHGNTQPKKAQPELFKPMALGKLTLVNRIMIAPMCQYSADNGNANQWHLMHYGSLAVSGAAMLILEATAVTAAGRISPYDLGLYNDENQAALSDLRQALGRFSPIPVAIQLAHAGRKASSHAPWNGSGALPPGDPLGWLTEAPSAIAHSNGDALPHELSLTEIDQLRQAFVEAAQRADAAGIDAIELHMAHGYLIHQFLSPLSNRRTDQYGGNLQNRMCFALEVFAAVRQAFNREKPVWVRISASDWVDGGWSVEESIELTQQLKAMGLEIIHVSSGGLSTEQRIPAEPGYQIGFAQRIKTEADIPTIAVGLITEPEQAEAILQAGQADAIAIARAALYDPRWPWHAAATLGAHVDAPAQYWRSLPHGFKTLFRNAHS